jgi:hypothetical protein
MKYLIIDTWNGEGYSESGIIGTAKTESEAVKKITQEFAERYVSMTEDFKCEWIQGKAIGFDNGEDQGCVQYLEAGIDDRYVVIDPMLNHAYVTSDSFNMLNLMLTGMGATAGGIELLKEDIIQVGSGRVEHEDGELIIQKI